MKRIFRKATLCIITLVLIASTLSICTSAAFYTQTITSSSTLTQILNIVKQNDGQTCYEKMYHIFYNSQFAAAYNKTFPYPNSGSSYNYVTDNGTKYTLSGSSRGCYLYADYVSQYVYGISSHSSKCVTVKINTSAGSMTSTQVKNAITTYAQAGEHIRIDNTHSIAFVAYTNDGFYYTSYSTDSNPKIYVHYTTWSNFASECNSKNKIGMIYDIDRSTNSNNDTVTIDAPTSIAKDTITATNAILNAWVNKPVGRSVTKIGIKIRKDGDTYANGWSKYETPSRTYTNDTGMQPYYNLNGELNLTLTHATKYYYQFFAKVGDKEYWSNEASFTTTGSHSYGNWSTQKAATCTASGTKTRKCSGCSKTETQTISALGHNFSSTYTVDKAATCTSAGSKSKHCSRCSATTSVTTIAATGHSYNAWTTVKNATCTTNGSAERKCLNCSVKDTKTISALGHDLKNEWVIDKNATCTDVGTKSHHCSRCNYICDITTISSLNHLWTDWAVTKKATTKSQGEKTRKCTRAGCNANEKITIAVLSEDGHEHNFGEWKTITEATCAIDGTTQRKCSICQQIEEKTITANGHQFSEWIVVSEATAEKDGLLERTCDACGEKDNQKIPKITNNDSSTEIKTNNTSNSKKPTTTIAIIVLSVIVLALSIACIILKFKKPSVKN